MVTYQEQKANKKYYILIESGYAIGLFGNLKRLCEFGKEYDVKFPSYSTLSKKKSDKMEFGNYIIQMMNLI